MDERLKTNLGPNFNDQSILLDVNLRSFDFKHNLFNKCKEILFRLLDF